jgi:hypothetical protein
MPQIPEEGVGWKGGTILVNPFEKYGDTFL